MKSDIFKPHPAPWTMVKQKTQLGAPILISLFDAKDKWITDLTNETFAALLIELSKKGTTE